MKICVVIPTFEPNFRAVKGGLGLAEFYIENIQGWLSTELSFPFTELVVVISDFASSEDFRKILRRLNRQHPKLSVLFGDRVLGSAEALNRGLSVHQDADVYVYAASDTKPALSDWSAVLIKELNENPLTSIIYTTCHIGGSKTCDQVQTRPIDKSAKVLMLEEQPIPNVVFFLRSIIVEYEFAIGYILPYDLGISLTWMALSIDTTRILSYRLFFHHDHFVEHGRHVRSYDSDNVKAGHQVRRAASNHIHLAEGYLPKPWPRPSVDTLKLVFTLPPSKAQNIPFALLVTLRLLKYLYSQIISVSGAKYFTQQIKIFGMRNYLFQRQSSKAKILAFIELKKSDRIILVRNLFFRR